MRIKICGLTRKADIEAVNRCLPDYAGFVFADGRRRLAPETAAALRAGLAPQIAAVGVFADEAPETAARIAELCKLNAVQLHGSEDKDDIRALRPLLPRGCEIWKAVAVRSAEDIRSASGLPADRLLLDAYSPLARGGTGLLFDWDLLMRAGPEKPYFIAGGITLENIASAVRLRGPFGVDLSSGAETDGLKDPEKIRRLVAAVREQEAKV